MANVLLIILLIISIILIGLILIQRSEGGALGIGGGGGGGGGGLMSGRGTANLVTRMTTILGTAFMIVSLMISISFNYQNRDAGLFDATQAEEGLVPATNSAETVNEGLNPDGVSANDVSPLADESQNGESSENQEEAP